MNMLSKYDERTQEAVKEFIDDFLNIFPGLLMEEELLKRINDNLETIDFEADLPSKTLGRYINKKILVNKKVVNKSQTLFHEFIHVITYGEFLSNFGYKNFIEGLTTLAEEKYVKFKKIKLPRAKRNVNAYVPTFVSQFNFITNGEALENFLVDPGSISKCFLSKILRFDLSPDKLGIKKDLEFDYFVPRNEYIIVCAERGDSDQKLIPEIIEIEKFLLEQYFLRLKTKKEKFDIDKLNKLYEIQLYPNIEEYLKIFDELIELRMLKYDDLSLLGNLGNLYILEDIDSEKLCQFGNLLEDSELDWLASKVFGYYEYLYDEMSLYKVYDDSEELAKVIKHYENMKPIYREILSEIIEGKLSIEDISNCKLVMSKPLEDTYDVQSYLLDNKSPEARLLEVLWDHKFVFPPFLIKDENEVKVIYSNDYFYYQTNHSDLVSLISESKCDYKDQLLEKLETFKDIRNIYIDSCFNEEVEDFGRYEINFFVSDDSDISQVTITNNSEKTYLNVNKVSFLGEEIDLFNGDTGKKLIKTFS